VVVAEMSIASWPELAVCTGSPALFFGPDAETAPERHRRVRKAREVCAGCPVSVACLEFARGSQSRHGVWGGVDFDRSPRPVCGNGLHVMDPANTMTGRDGYKCCVACHEAKNERQRGRRQERKVAV
jgi:hypothetical protein